MKHSNSSRNDTLDCVRAVLILAVMVYHYTIRWMPPGNEANLYGYAEPYSPIFEFGGLGVDIFFVLSGYFITVTLSKSRNAMEFAYRRMLRIYPAFIVACSFTFVFMAIFGPSQLAVGLKDYLASLTVMPNRFGALYVDGAYWSLEVEVKFYFFIALTFLFFGRHFALAMVGLALLSIPIEAFNEAVARQIMISHKLSLFLLGMSLAFFRSKDLKTSAVLFGVFILMFGLHLEQHSMGSNIVVLAASAILAYLIIFEVRVSARPVAYLGIISYETYLVHQNFGVSVISMMKQNGTHDLLAMACAGTTSIAIAAFIHHVAQRPIASAFRYAYGRLKPPAAAQPA